VGSGIGKETALLFVKEEAKVVVADMNEKAGEETVAELKKKGEGFLLNWMYAIENKQKNLSLLLSLRAKAFTQITYIINV